MEVGISLRMEGKGELVLHGPSLRAGGVEGERVGGTPLSSFPLLPAGACPAGDLHFLSSSGGTWSPSTRASDSGGPPGDTGYSPGPPPQTDPHLSFQQKPKRVSGLVSHAPASPLIGILLLFPRVQSTQSLCRPSRDAAEKADSEVSPLGILIP